MAPLPRLKGYKLGAKPRNPIQMRTFCSTKDISCEFQYYGTCSYNYYEMSFIEPKTNWEYDYIFHLFSLFFLVFVDIAKMENHLENYNLTVIWRVPMCNIRSITNRISQKRSFKSQDNLLLF